MARVPAAEPTEGGKSPIAGERARWWARASGMKPKRDLKTKEGAALAVLFLSCLLEDGLADACGLADELLVPPGELPAALLALPAVQLRRLLKGIATMAQDDILPGPFRAGEMSAFLTGLSESRGMPRNGNGGQAH